MEKEAVKQGLQNIIDLLYQQKAQDAYGRLIGTLPALEEQAASLGEEQQRVFSGILRDALKAMEQNDLTLLADIIQYDLMEQL